MPIKNDIKNLILNGNLKVNLSGCGLNDEDMEEISQLLLQNKSITSVDFHGNNISSDGIMHLASCPHLQEIDLHDNNVDDYGIPALLQIKSLRHLILDNNNLTDKGGKLLFERVGKDFYVQLYGNTRISRSLIDAIREKRSNSLAHESEAANVANNPSAKFAKQNGQPTKEAGVKRTSDCIIKENGHKKSTPT